MTRKARHVYQRLVSVFGNNIIDMLCETMEEEPVLVNDMVQIEIK